MKNYIQRLLNRFTQPAATAGAPRAPTASKPAAPGREQEPGDRLAKPAPSAGDPPARWLEAISNATEAVLALGWLDQLQEEADLAQVATRARLADLRLAAAQRVQDETLLKRIAEQAQHKDKSVYRLCQAALKTAAIRRQRNQQLASLEHKLQALLEFEPLPPGRRFELQQALTQLSPGDDLQRCELLLAEARERELVEAGRLQQLADANAQADRMKAGLAADPILPIADIEALRNQVMSVRDQFSQWPEWLQTHKQGGELRSRLDEVDQRLNIATSDLARIDECRRFLAAQATAPMTKVSMNAWAAMPKPSSAKARAALEDHWNVLREARGHSERDVERRTTVRKPSQFDRTAFIAALAQLEQAIENGETLAARNLSKSLRDMLGNEKLDSSLGARYRSALKSLHSLRGWARWSGVHVRAELLEAAQGLLDPEVDLDERRKKVPLLRAEWNRLNVQNPAPADQRERFNALLDAAFQPVISQRAAVSRQRAEARAVHDARLQEWEAWLSSVDWASVEPQAVQKVWQKIRVERRSLPALQGPDARRSSRRFAKLAAEIRAHLEPLSKVEIERREALIAAAVRLQDAADLQLALSHARQLQTRWRDESAPVLLKRELSEALWQRFRVAIDIVYARRTEQRSAQQAAVEQARSRREELLQRFAAAIDGADSPSAVDQAREQFESDWEAAVSGMDARQSSRLRFQELLDRADAKRKSFAAARQQSYFRHLAEKAALAERLEHEALAGAPDPSVVSEIAAQWKDIPAVPGGAERLLEARLQAATTATGERLQQGLELRGIALLDLEIWLDIPTPDPLTDLRRQRQLQLLQSGKNRHQTEEQLRTAVVRWYATTAHPDPVQQERIARVIQRLTDARQLSA